MPPWLLRACSVIVGLLHFDGRYPVSNSTSCVWSCPEHGFDERQTLCVGAVTVKSKLVERNTSRPLHWGGNRLPHPEPDIVAHPWPTTRERARFWEKKPYEFSRWSWLGGRGLTRADIDKVTSARTKSGYQDFKGRLG